MAILISLWALRLEKNAIIFEMGWSLMEALWDLIYYFASLWIFQTYPKKKKSFQNPIKHENIRLDIHLLLEDEAHGGVR